MRFNVVLAATISSVAALPAEPTLEARAVNCAKITGALSVLKNLGPPATTFCSSFLKVPATATITTTTTSTSTVITSTATSTTTSSVCPAPADSACGQSGCGPQKAVVKVAKKVARVAAPEAEPVVNILPLLAAFAQAKISEGCSCLNIKPKITTTTTATALPSTTNVVSTTTACITPPLSDTGRADGNVCYNSNQCASGCCSEENLVLVTRPGVCQSASLCLKNNGASCNNNADCASSCCVVNSFVPNYCDISSACAPLGTDQTCPDASGTPGTGAHDSCQIGSTCCAVIGSDRSMYNVCTPGSTCPQL